MSEEIVYGIMTGEDIVRDGHIIVNHIGEAVYIDIAHITAEELTEILDYKIWLEELTEEV